MGMESYSINLLPEGVTAAKVDGKDRFNGRSSIHVLDFIELLEGRGFKIELNDFDSLIAAHAVFINFGIEEEAFDILWVKEITFEGCFACFEYSLGLFYSLYQIINKQIVKVRLYHPSIGEFEAQSEACFYEKIKSLYCEKYKRFKESYGTLDTKVLPGDAFYRSLKFLKLKQCIKDIFRGKFFGS